MNVYEFPLVRSHTSRCRTGYRREPDEYLQVGDEVDDSLARPFVLRNLQGINDAGWFLGDDLGGTTWTQKMWDGQRFANFFSKM